MKIAVMGAGVMGRGWIAQFAMHGHEVHCHDSNAETLSGVREFCQKLVGKAVRRFKLEDASLPAKADASIFTYAEVEAFLAVAKQCDVFFEVIFEDMELKCSILREVVPQLPPEVYFWSNTSSLDIDVLSEAGGRPERSLVCHGMNPVPLMPGVEVVPGARTTAETVEFCRQILLQLGKAPFMAPNIPGFLVNRLLIPQMLDAIRLLEAGQFRVEDADTGLSTCLGHPQGTFKLADFISIPTLLRIAVEMYLATSDPRLYPPVLLGRMVKRGEYGASTGKGFYDWSDPRNPVPRDFCEFQLSSAEVFTDAVS